MKIQELIESKNTYTCVEISHEPRNEIFCTVVSDGAAEDYFIGVTIDDKTWKIKSFNTTGAAAKADLKNDKDLIVAAVNKEFKKHAELKPVTLSEQSEQNPEKMSLSDFRPIQKWMEEAFERAFGVLDEDEAKWEKFEKDLGRQTSEEQVEVFLAQPSVDQLHYNSNGLPDQGKTAEFLENFESFKSAFDEVLSRMK